MSNGNYTLTVGELQARLSEHDPKQPIQFYVLNGGDLTGCDVETILDMDHQLEITIESVTGES